MLRKMPIAMIWVDGWRWSVINEYTQQAVPSLKYPLTVGYLDKAPWPVTDQSFANPWGTDIMCSWSHVICRMVRIKVKGVLYGTCFCTRFSLIIPCLHYGYTKCVSLLHLWGWLRHNEGLWAPDKLLSKRGVKRLVLDGHVHFVVPYRTLLPPCHIQSAIDTLVVALQRAHRGFGSLITRSHF